MKQEVKESKIAINNPSQLVLEVEELFQLRKKLPSQHESLKAREKAIFNRLGERKIEKFNGILMFEIDIANICNKINMQYADGVILEEDNISYPFSRSLRRSPTTLEAPTKTQELSAKKGMSIHLGNHLLIGNSQFVINKLSIPTLALEATIEEGYKRR